MNGRGSQYDFLAACLAGQPILPAAFQEATDSVDALFSTASAEAVLPALYPNLRDLGLLHQLPSEVAESLEAASTLNRERNQYILAQAHAIVGRLNSVGVEPVALKGLAYLLSGVFSDLAIRYLMDLDFLIPESQLPAAIDALSQAGYTPDSQDTLARFRHHAPQMQRANSIPVELHRSLGLGIAARLLPAAEVIARSSLTAWNGAQVRLPSPNHLAAHLILHSQIRHPYRERIWPPLRAMYDLLLLNRRWHSSLDWLSIEQRFRAGGQRTTLYLHLLRVEQTLGMARPFPISLSPFEELRWLRRSLLRRAPVLRFIDPVYWTFSLLSRRVRLLQSILSTPQGWKEAAKTLSQPAFYRRLLGELSL